MKKQGRKRVEAQPARDTEELALHKVIVDRLLSYGLTTDEDLHYLYLCAGCSQGEARNHVQTIKSKCVIDRRRERPTLNNAARYIAESIGIKQVNGFKIERFNKPLSEYSRTLPDSFIAELFRTTNVQTRPQLYQLFVENGHDALSALKFTKAIMETPFYVRTHNGEYPTTAYNNLRKIMDRAVDFPSEFVTDGDAERPEPAPHDIDGITEDFEAKLQALAAISAPPSVKEETAAQPEKISVERIVTKREIFGPTVTFPTKAIGERLVQQLRTPAKEWQPPRNSKLLNNKKIPFDLRERLGTNNIETDVALRGLFEAFAPTKAVGYRSFKELTEGKIYIAGTREFRNCATLLVQALDRLDQARAPSVENLRQELPFITNKYHTMPVIDPLHIIRTEKDRTQELRKLFVQSTYCMAKPLIYVLPEKIADTKKPAQKKNGQKFVKPREIQKPEAKPVSVNRDKPDLDEEIGFDPKGKSGRTAFTLLFKDCERYPLHSNDEQRTVGQKYQDEQLSLIKTALSIPFAVNRLAFFYAAENKRGLVYDRRNNDEKETISEREVHMSISTGCSAHYSSLIDSPAKPSDSEELALQILNVYPLSKVWQALGKKIKANRSCADHISKIEQYDHHLLEIKKYQDVLVQHNLRLAYSIARNICRFTGEDVTEMTSAAIEGLVRAADRWTFRKAKFQTFAFSWIRQFIAITRKNHSRTIRIPASAQEKLHKISSIEAKSFVLTGSKVSIEEIADETGLSVQQVVFLKTCDNTLSLDAPTNRTEDTDTLMDFVPSNARCPEDILLAREQTDTVQNVLNELRPREIDILKKRFFEDMTLEEVGQTYDITRERVRQIEKRALARMRHPSRSYKIQDFHNDPLPDPA